MKKILITILLSLISSIGLCQLPVSENFNTQPATWTNTNGAGYQNYGGANYWLTTNIGTTPYPNSSIITMTSPVYNLSSCSGSITLSFLLNGIIQNNSDFMYFEYFNGSVWTTIGTYTGTQSNVNVVFTTIPSNATRFRFRLVTNGSINGYCKFFHPIFGCLNTAVYYYDIDNFSLTCNISLPIELISFDGFNQKENNILKWTTVSENNNDYFIVERSEDGINWLAIDSIDGAGNSQEIINYALVDSDYRQVINYYRLKQFDYDGEYELFEKIVAINNVNKNKQILFLTNLLGQIVNEEATGVLIVHYTDGTNEKIYR